MSKTLPFLFFLVAVLGCVNSVTRNTQSNSSQTPEHTATSIQTPTPDSLTATVITPTPGKATSENLAKAAEILAANTEHYAQLLKEGKVILGTKAYPNAYAGLAALDDPKSSASKFSKFNNSLSNEMSCQDAFAKADAFFTADNEPDSITQWQEDMLDATGDLFAWGQAGVSWQVDASKAPKLHSLEQKVNIELAKARADIAALRKGK